MSPFTLRRTRHICTAGCVVVPSMVIVDVPLPEMGPPPVDSPPRRRSGHLPAPAPLLEALPPPEVVPRPGAPWSPSATIGRSSADDRRLAAEKPFDGVGAVSVRAHVGSAPR